MTQPAAPTVAETEEALVRQFAKEYPTPNVKRAVALCEDGTLPWSAVAGLFEKSLKTAFDQAAADAVRGV